MKRILDIVAVFVVAAVIVTGAVPARAQKISFIRDAEIENTIRRYAAPVFRAAGLNAENVRIHLVNDSSLNAFVAGGQRLFINTGLLMRSDNAGQIIGVIAHETGHIAGGHLARIQDALENSTAATILSLLLGGAAIGAGRGDVGAAIIAGGQGVAMRNLLSYTRAQESAADHAAMTFLERAGISARGFLEFMELLSEQEMILPERQDPYVRTHPMAAERVETIRAHVKKSPNTGHALPPEFEVMHRRMVAKLTGYLQPLGRTLRVYKESDNSVESRYARAIGYYRKPDLEKALKLVDGLIAEAPDDPYFRELKGQMLFENGDARGALGPYERAVELRPGENLFRSELARVQIELQDPALLDDAIENLRRALSEEKDSPGTWRQLAIAYGRKGDKGRSALALAEEALLMNRVSEARYHAGLAERLFPDGSREWLQARDILLAARNRDGTGN